MHGTRFIPFLILLLLQGCASSPGAPGPASPDQHDVSSNDGTFTVRWASDPSPIPVNEFFELDVIVMKDGRIFDGTTLQVDAAMPQHQHGMNHRPHVEQVGPGRWHVKDMLFHMPGEWVLYFDVVQGDVLRRAQEQVEVD